MISYSVISHSLLHNGTELYITSNETTAPGFTGVIFFRQFERMIYNEVIGMEEFWVRVEPRNFFQAIFISTGLGTVLIIFKILHDGHYETFRPHPTLETCDKPSIHPIHPIRALGTTKR